jgi:DNA-binding transcriptional regulator YdaS (Cro superfamily)
MFGKLETKCLTNFKQFVLLLVMDLKSYMSDRALGGKKMAEIIGDVTGAAVRLWMTGARMPSAEIAERIVKATDGAVTVQDLHNTRLEFLNAAPHPHSEVA